MKASYRHGLTLIEVLVVIAIIGVLVGMTLAGIHRVRAAADRACCQDHLRQIGIALQHHNDTKGSLPPGTSVKSDDGAYQLLGWLPRLLPYIGQEALWQETVAAFRQDPWFGNIPPHTPGTIPIRLFGCPADSRVADAHIVQGHPRGLTSYLGVVGNNAGIKDGLLYTDSQHRLADATDGASQTILVGERPPSADLVLGWWYAGRGQNYNGDADMILGVRSRNYGPQAPGCPLGPYHFTPGRFNYMCDAFHFWSPHPGGAHFAFADGSVRFLTYSADPIMPALATRAGGEVVAIPN